MEIALAAEAPQSNDAIAWQLIQVPGTWEADAEGRFQEHDGFAWYRCYVKVPDSWVDNKLYADSLVLAVNNVADAHETFVNGIKLGAAGTLPPHFASGYDEVRRYKIPPTALKKDIANVIAIRVFNNQDEGGFKGSAPLISSYEHEIKLEGSWEFHLGDDLSWAIEPPQTKPATAIFDKVEEASFVLKPTRELIHGDRLSPSDSLATMKVNDDLAVDQVLTEPIVAQPVFLNFDERGRMWVVQYRQYPHPAGLEMVSRNRYYRAVYDKVPPPPPNHFRGADQISIHEDTNGDGSYDRHKTFLEGLSIVTSAVRGRGGVWVLNPPYLLFYPDADDDDVPDGDPIVHLSGFGLEDTHAATNSLCWGPDGWLYSTQGSNTVAHLTVLGHDKPTGFMDGPGVWRYHPETHQFEVFAEGGGNAFGLEIDSQGRIYSGHNGFNTRGFHYVQGGYYDKGWEGKFMPVSNPNAFGTLPMMTHGEVPRFTHAFIRYEGAALPEKYNDKLFCVDPLRQHIMVSEISPRGSTFRTRDVGPALSSEDPAFRPVAINVGPDGAVYVADFYEYYIAHGQHYQGQIDPTTGRVYRIRAKDGRFAQPFDLRGKSTAELANLLSHPNKWYRQTALRMIADRRDKSIVPRLRNSVQKESGQVAVESLWALYQLGALDDALAAATLNHPNPTVRLWTVRFLGDANQVSSELAKKLVVLTTTEKNLEVLCQLAATARRLPAQEGLAIARQLLMIDSLADDPYLPLMIWWALESKCESDRDAVVSLFIGSATQDNLWDRPLVARHIAPWLMRRFAAAGTHDDLLAAARLLQSAVNDSQIDQLMAGFKEAFKGRPFGTLPTELMQQLRRTPLAKSLAFRLRMADAAAVDEALPKLNDHQAPLAERLELIDVFADVVQPRCVPPLLALLDSPSESDSLRIAAMTALQRYTDPEIGKTVTKLYGTLTPDVAAAAQTLLVIRPEWTLQLLQGVKDGYIPANAISVDTARKMLLHSDKRIAESVAKIWGEIKGTPNDQMREQIQKYSQTLANGTGNPYAGRALFENSCGKCHSLFGKGGQIGPDLTPMKRDDVSALLINIVNPSAEIREGFETYVAIAEGRVITGFLVQQDQQIVALRTQDGQTIRIPRDELEEDGLHKSGVSIMPEGILNSFNEQQLRDLFAYLRSTQPAR